MCAYSMVMDWGRDSLRKWEPTWQPNTNPYLPHPMVPAPGPGEVEQTHFTIRPAVPSKDEMDCFIKQFEDLLKRAKKYDVDNNQPDCELDEKRMALKKLADELGITINFPA